MKIIKYIKAYFKIPSGLYCDNCPYWHISSEHEPQNNGYCEYMNYGDWEAEEWGGFTLLWDGDKECGIKTKSIKEILTFGYLR